MKKRCFDHRSPGVRPAPTRTRHSVTKGAVGGNCLHKGDNGCAAIAARVTRCFQPPADPVRPARPRAQQQGRARQGKAGRQPEARLGSACPASCSRPHPGSLRLAAGRTPALSLNQSEAAKAISVALIGCLPPRPGRRQGERRASAAGESASPCRPCQPR